MKQLLAGVFLLFASTVCFAEYEAEIEAATTWLGLVDSGEYAESWEQSAPLLQVKIKKKQWQETMEQMRAPLGAALSRKIVQAGSKKRLDGLPRGKYVLFIVETNFSGQSGATEIITVKNDDEWRVTGYVIQ